MCTCCACCCQILKGYKRHPRPAEIAATPFRAELNPHRCKACGACVDRCQMSALSMVQKEGQGTDDRRAVLDPDQCIGCGLCVSACPTGALTLRRKPAAETPVVPRTIEGTYLRMARARGKMTAGDMIKMVTRSGIDRLRAAVGGTPRGK